jgi:hypothetical protein
MTGILRLEADPGLLTNRRMSLEIGVGLATLSGRRLSMPWSAPLGPAPGPRPASEPNRDERPRVDELWEISGDLVSDEEWRELEHGGRRLDLAWNFRPSVYLADRSAVPDPGVREFAGGRTTFVRIPDTDADVVQISGRPLTWYSYFFHATGDTRRGLLGAVEGVRLRQPFEDLGARIATDLGRHNVAHIRRTDHVKGIRAYAGVSPLHIADGVAEVLPTDEPLLIATEADPASTLFDPLRGRYAEVVFITDLILGDYKKWFEELPVSEDNALGAVTQVIAARADRFVGTLGSTFTGLIQRLRTRRDVTEPFLFTTDFTPPGATFLKGAYVDQRPGRYSWNRLGLAVAPGVLAWLREWPEAVTSPDDQPTAPAARRSDQRVPLHAVACTDMNPYGDWQFRFQEHTWRRASQPGELVRLVAMTESDAPPAHNEARVVTTRSMSDRRAPDYYPGLERLWSLQEWLATEHPRGSVLILDADMVFRASVLTTTEPGTIVAQEWYRFGPPKALGQLDTPIRNADPSKLPPLTWPMIVDAADLASFLPRWLKLTVELRRFTGGWESDMFGLVVAVAESGLRVRFETLGAWMNWPEDFVAGAPILHYCQPVEHRDGSRLWFKQDWRPYAPLGLDPNDAKLDYCRDLLHLLDEFTRARLDASAPGPGAAPVPGARPEPRR